MPHKKKVFGLLSCWLILISASFLFSCTSTRNITKEDFLYFQSGLDSMKRIQVSEPIIHVNDVLSIQVSSSSLNQEQTVPFNLPPSTNSAGYLVNTAGNIDMPVLGSVKAAGLTQDALQKFVTEKLSNYVKDPIVLVHFLQFKVNVLGEVKSPGVQKFDVDRVTLLDAIGAAGDLGDKAKREDITVIREEGGTRKVYKVDIRSGSLFQSPAYILQSNDIVYVGASFQKFKELKNATTNTAQRGLQLVATVLGLVTSILLTVNLLTE
jgi:polysaccharide export outer membrane protein